MSYYDIDDILTDAVEVPCKFNYEIPGLGYLEGSPGKPVNKNAKIELPLWLARILAIVGGDNDGDESIEEDSLPFVELLTPEMFHSKVINAIKASAETLDVHSINAHFSEFAMKWVALFADSELGQILSQLILQRSVEIHRHASSVAVNTAASETNQNINSAFLLSMDEQEKRLYRSSHSSYKDSKRWMYQR